MIHTRPVAEVPPAGCPPNENEQNGSIEIVKRDENGRERKETNRHEGE